MGEFTADERAAVIASVVSSQALAGVTITPDEAGALLDGLAGTPLPSIGAERAGMDEAPPLTEDALAAIERDAGGPEVRALCAEVRRVWAFCDSLRPLVAEVGRLRAVAAAATVLRARVRDWGAVPFEGPGHEEAYEFATNAAEDAILVAASAFDAALASSGDEPR